MIIETPLVYFYVENRNGRVYTPTRTIPILEAFQQQKGKNSIFGQIGRADGTIDIQWDKVSHVVKNFWIVGNVMWGQIEILNNSEGEKLKLMLDQVVFRIRSAGEINHSYVQLKEGHTIGFDAIPTDEDSYNDCIMSYPFLNNRNISIDCIK